MLFTTSCTSYRIFLLADGTFITFSEKRFIQLSHFLHRNTGLLIYINFLAWNQPWCWQNESSITDPIWMYIETCMLLVKKNSQDLKVPYVKRTIQESLKRSLKDIQRSFIERSWKIFSGSLQGPESCRIFARTLRILQESGGSLQALGKKLKNCKIAQYLQEFSWDTWRSLPDL